MQIDFCLLFEAGRGEDVMCTHVPKASGRYLCSTGKIQTQNSHQVGR